MIHTVGRYIVIITSIEYTDTIQSFKKKKSCYLKKWGGGKTVFKLSRFSGVKVREQPSAT